jgi:hypothetical protein
MAKILLPKIIAPIYPNPQFGGNELEVVRDRLVGPPIPGRPALDIKWLKIYRLSCYVLGVPRPRTS